MRKRAAFARARALVVGAQQGQRALVEHDLDAERAGDGIGGDVVVGRPDAAGGENVVEAGAQRVDGRDDGRLLVADDAHLLQPDADGGEVLGDEADVAVLGAPRRISSPMTSAAAVTIAVLAWGSVMRAWPGGSCLS